MLEMLTSLPNEAEPFGECDYDGRLERMQPLPEFLDAPYSKFLVVLESEPLVVVTSVKHMERHASSLLS
jgi:hypothetical protein